MDTDERKTMRIHSKDFQVGSGKRFDLKKWPTIVKPYCKTKKQYQELLENTLQS